MMYLNLVCVSQAAFLFCWVADSRLVVWVHNPISTLVTGIFSLHQVSFCVCCYSQSHPAVYALNRGIDPAAKDLKHFLQR